MSYPPEPYGRTLAPEPHVEVIVRFKDLRGDFSRKKALMRKWLAEHQVAYSVGYGDYNGNHAEQPYYIQASHALLFKLSWGGR